MSGVQGTLWGIGVGPGDPEYLTLKAARLIAGLPVVAYPQNPQGESQAKTLAMAHLPKDVVELPLVMDFAPDREQALTAYEQGRRAITSHLEAGRDVGVLCLGDPLMYGSFLHLIEGLDAAFNIQIVPGITSMAAAAAASGTPLALANGPLSVVPATAGEAVFRRYLEASVQSGGSLAVLKLGRHLPWVADVLRQHDLLEQAVLAERVGWPEGRTNPLAEALAADDVSYFSLLLIRCSRP